MNVRAALADVRKALPLVLLRVGLVLVLLEVSYLVVAHALLMTPLLRSIVNPAEDVELEYDWAYSPWPGRIYVKNLALRVEDYNVQFFVGVERGTLDVRLEELAARRFHAVRVVGEGTTYRMRHKLHDVGKDARRVAAYPPIAGFADPPLYRGPQPPPIPDSEYALWEVKIDEVAASVREVWILEYRYQGAGRAWGNFHVRPARWYEIESSGLKLERGTLTVAGVPLAKRADLEVACRVLGTDPRSGSGLEPLRTIFASVSGRLGDADLRFLDLYLEPFLGLKATGGADVGLGVAIDAGVLREDSRVVVETRAVGLGNAVFHAQGAPRIELTVPREPIPPSVRVEAKVERLEFGGAAAQIPGPFLENVEATLTLTRNLSQPLRLLGASLKVPRAVAPDLAWFEGLLDSEAPAPKLRGKATARFMLEQREERAVHGETSVRLDGARISRGPLNFGGDFKLDSRFEGARGFEGELALRDFEFRAEGATLSTADRRTPPWTAVIASDDVRIASFEPLRALGSVAVRATRTEPLLPLVVESGVLRELLVAGLGLKELTGNARFELEPQYARLEVGKAHSGAVTARGFLESRREQKPKARFLFSTGVANVGVRVEGGETSVKPLVSDDWLPKTALVLPRASH